MMSNDYNHQMIITLNDDVDHYHVDVDDYILLVGTELTPAGDWLCHDQTTIGAGAVCVVAPILEHRLDVT